MKGIKATTVLSLALMKIICRLKKFNIFGFVSVKN